MSGTTGAPHCTCVKVARGDATTRILRHDGPSCEREMTTYRA
ncbi:hypothetical protein [Noviherbaspirillum galbum]|nr:hypothetical protein [Noviherbaspirillum galbum]